ncbi:MAG TPA: hypothetical protein VH415_06240 [Nitrososphaeraceae archaeon]
MDRYGKKGKVDIRMIDLAMEELRKLIIKLEKNVANTKKDKTLVQKIEDIPHQLQDAVVLVKLKESVES